MLGQESVKRLVQCLEERHVPHAGSLRLTTSLVQRHTTAVMNQEKVSLQTLSQELLRIARQISALEENSRQSQGSVAIPELNL